MQRILVWFIAFVFGMLMAIVFVGTAVELLYLQPVPGLDALPATPAGKDNLFAVLGSRLYFYLQVFSSFWPFWILPFLAFFVGWFVYMRIRRSREERLLEQVYFLEQNLEQVSRFEKTAREKLDVLHDAIVNVYEQASEALIYLNLEGVIAYRNPAAVALFGKWTGNKDQLQNRMLADCIPDFMNSGLARELRGLQVAGSVWRGELPIERTDLYLDVKLIRANEGYYVILRDTTHHHTGEGELQASKVLLEQLVKQSPEPFAVLDANWVFSYATESFRTFFGVQERNLAGKAYDAVLGTFPNNLADIRGRVAMGRGVKVREEPLNVAGKEHFVNWRIDPWQNAYGELGGYMIFVSDVTEQKQAQQRLNQLEEQENKLAYSDLLTGLPNRQLFYDRLNMALAVAYRQLTKVGVMFLDLDGFKAVNDNLGHDVGDLLLKEVATRLQECVRKSDTVARLGGDEFTIVANIRDKEDCKVIADKIIERVSAPYDLGDNKGVRVTTSIGVSVYPTHGGTAADLIRKADLAMYIAKHSGKNQSHFYSPEDEKAEALQERSTERDTELKMDVPEDKKIEAEGEQTGDV